MQQTKVLIREKTQELEQLQRLGAGRDVNHEKALKDELNGLMEQEDLKWRQRAKEEWLRNGDRNTKYFHACAKQRQEGNQIVQVLDEAGQVCNTQETIEQAFIDYYQNLFKSEMPQYIAECNAAIKGKVSTAMNNQLMAEFTAEEVGRALSQMAPLKASGPDWFTAGFYQQHWATVGPEVCNAILQFLNFLHMDESINATHIALIPKKANPCCVYDFRPISLFNVLYKLISKVLANQLKMVLPHIISSNQSAFLPGRLITDNIIAAYETLHTMHTRMWSRMGFMGIKLDISKAYDRVEWAFLETVMRKMCFSERLIQLLMKCV